MSIIDRRLRLTADGAGLGLSCTADGLSLAGVPLLRKTINGLAPRPADEIARLLRAALGPEADPTPASAGLQVAARALDDGDISRAMIAALRLGLPELDWKAAARLARANETLAKYNPEEDRDWHGRWTTGDSRPPAKAPKRQPLPPPPGLRAGDHQQPPCTATPGDDARTAALNHVLSTFYRPRTPGNLDPVPTLRSLLPKFEAQFDELGPKEFSLKVTEFGNWLANQGHNLNYQQRLAATAQYMFLQNRVLFWQRYEQKPAATSNYINTAAYALYMGGVNGGLVSVGEKGDPPPSMRPVQMDVLFYDGPRPSFHPGVARSNLIEESARPQLLTRYTELNDFDHTARNVAAELAWENGGSP